MIAECHREEHGSLLLWISGEGDHNLKLVWNAVLAVVFCLRFRFMHLLCHLLAMPLNALQPLALQTKQHSADVGSARHKTFRVLTSRVLLRKTDSDWLCVPLKHCMTKLVFMFPHSSTPGTQIGVKKPVGMSLKVTDSKRRWQSSPGRLCNTGINLLHCNHYIYF